LNLGGFTPGWTRDDVAGLRLFAHDEQCHWESPAAGSALIGSTTIGVTNLSSQSCFTLHYNAF